MEKRRTEASEDLRALEFVARKYFMGPGLYDYQKDLYWRLESNTFNVINKSRQIGISFFYAGFTTWKAIRGEKCLIVSPAERQSKRVMQYIDSWLEGFRRCIPRLDEEIKEHNKTHLLFRNGGEVAAMPNSAHSIRGSAARYLFLDEWAHFLHGTDQQIWEALLPSLVREKRMSVCANSTPFGETNLFYQMFANRESYPDFVPTFYHYSECPAIDIELIKRNLDTLSFAQEFEGQFIGDLDTYYPYSLTRNCINPELEYLSDLAQCKFPLYAAADIGRRRDFTALVVLAEIQGKLRVVYKQVLKSEEEKKWDNQYALFRTILKAPKLCRLYMDEAFGQEMVERLQRESNGVVIPFRFDNENKAQMHPAFRKRLEEGGIEMPEDMELINSLHMIQRTQSGNTVRYESDKRTDEHGHADLAVALVLANHAYEIEGGALPVAKGFEKLRFRPGREAVIRGLERVRRN